MQKASRRLSPAGHKQPTSSSLAPTAARRRCRRLHLQPPSPPPLRQNRPNSISQLRQLSLDDRAPTIFHVNHKIGGCLPRRLSSPLLTPSTFSRRHHHRPSRSIDRSYITQSPPSISHFSSSSSLYARAFCDSKHKYSAFKRSHTLDLSVKLRT